jgi:glycolate oxidase FAD binding subunit
LAGFGGHRAAVDRSIREVTEAHPGTVPQILREMDAEAAYEHLADVETGRATDGQGDGTAGLGLRASVPKSRAIDVVLAAQSCADTNGLTVVYRAGSVRGRVDLVFTAAKAEGDDEGGSGRLGFDAEGFATCLTQTRADATRMGGSLFVTGGGGLLPFGYDAWGDLGPAVTLMKRIKERFDPKGVLNPGRFVGGI